MSACLTAERSDPIFAEVSIFDRANTGLPDSSLTRVNFPAGEVEADSGLQRPES
jgi:hypothetical protein